MRDTILEIVETHRKDSEYEDDEIKWMESQAKSITPKILMPKKMFIRQYKEFLRINKRNVIIINYIKHLYH